MLLTVATLFLLNGLVIILSGVFCMSTTVGVNGTVQFTFFLVMTLNITVVTSLKLENGLRNHVRNVAEIKHGFAKLFVIFLLLALHVPIPDEEKKSS